MLSLLRLRTLTEPSAERESERLYTRVEELDGELSIDDRFRLSYQLIQPLFDDRAVAAFVHVQAVSGARRLPVNRHAETYRALLPGRPHDEMKVARVEVVHDSRRGACRGGRLTAFRPLAGKGPLIE